LLLNFSVGKFLLFLLFGFQFFLLIFFLFSNYLILNFLRLSHLCLTLFFNSSFLLFPLTLNFFCFLLFHVSLSVCFDDVNLSFSLGRCLLYLSIGFGLSNFLDWIQFLFLSHFTMWINFMYKTFCWINEIQFGFADILMKFFRINSFR